MMNAPRDRHATTRPSQLTNQGDNDYANAARSGNNQQNNRHQSQRGPCFKGKCKELARHIYNVGTPNSAQDLFTNMTCKIAEYAVHMYTDASDIGSGLPSLQLPAQMPPPHPAVNDVIAIEI
jgi:hypothetical protein